MKRLASRGRREGPTKRRPRRRALLPLPERLKQLAERAKQAAEELPPGKERDRCLLKAAQAENVWEFVRLLRAEGGRNPAD
jgi:hypothetical protein